MEGSSVRLDRISIDPNICHGQACVKGTRIPVHQIVRMLANGDTVETLLADYPTLVREDIMACLDYAAELTEEQITPISVAKGTGRGLLSRTENDRLLGRGPVQD